MTFFRSPSCKIHCRGNSQYNCGPAIVINTKDGVPKDLDLICEGTNLCVANNLGVNINCLTGSDDNVRTTSDMKINYMYTAITLK